jgi:hypothetical protein
MQTCSLWFTAVPVNPGRDRLTIWFCFMVVFSAPSGQVLRAAGEFAALLPHYHNVEPLGEAVNPQFCGTRFRVISPGGRRLSELRRFAPQRLQIGPGVA